MRSVLGEETVTQELRVTAEGLDQKVLEWNHKSTPEQNSVADFYKEHHVETFVINVKNFDSKSRVLETIGEKIEFNMQDSGLDLEPSDTSEQMLASKALADQKLSVDGRSPAAQAVSDNRRPQE